MKDQHTGKDSNTYSGYDELESFLTGGNVLRYNNFGYTGENRKTCSSGKFVKTAY